MVWLVLCGRCHHRLWWQRQSLVGALPPRRQLVWFCCPSRHMRPGVCRRWSLLLLHHHGLPAAAVGQRRDGRAGVRRGGRGSAAEDPSDGAQRRAAAARSAGGAGSCRCDRFLPVQTHRQSDVEGEKEKGEEAAEGTEEEEVAV